MYLSTSCLLSIIYLYTFLVTRIILLDIKASNYVYLGDAPSKYFISLSRDAVEYMSSEHATFVDSRRGPKDSH